MGTGLREEEGNVAKASGRAKLRIMLHNLKLLPELSLASQWLPFRIYVYLHTFIMYKQCVHSSHVCVHICFPLELFHKLRETNDLL